MKKVSWEALPGIITTEVSEVLEKTTRELSQDIKAAWPVASGRSKAGWKVRRYKSGNFAVVNFVKAPGGYNYVADLWEGMPKGSSQLPNGGDPILRRHQIRLRREFEGLTL